MSVDRDTLLQVLPCYVVGDLPPEVMDAIARQVGEDDELRRVVSELTVSKEACQAIIARQPPGSLFWSPRPVVVERPAPAAFAALLALALVATLGLLALQPERLQPRVGRQEGVRLVEVALAGTPEALPGWMETGDEAALAAHLRARGVSLAVVDAARSAAPALRLVGGAPAPAGGVALGFRGPDGLAITGIVAPELPTPPAPGEARMSRTDGDPERVGWEREGLAGVTWSADGHTCLLTARAPLHRLLRAADPGTGGR